MISTEKSEAYRYWVCSQFFPVYLKGHIVKPCRQFCHEVERKCPYLLPKDKPVAGEPSFLCQDPNIGELRGQESSYGDDSCCYHMCQTEKAPGHHPTICYTFPTTAATNYTIATAASVNSSPSLSSSSSGSNGSSSNSGGGVMSLENMDNGGDSQCLSALGADSCLCQSNHSPVAPLSSSSCTVISRKHCWTRTALYILLLCLVRTRALMPRGFT
ncbi:NALCN channel auxiliary factor 1 isoform X2 [Palaemon carinicauda]|uniref:NALCN channel auxiliary factor 1 isoform X1 n=1 Tax=Palaemon carinicauda TaxID=392227 RepID=UPI0035B5D7D4